jgi:hypothetical protein
METPNDIVMRGMVEAALEISRRQRDTLRLLKQALEDDDIEQIKKHARQLCGLEKYDEPEKQHAKHKTTRRRSAK